MAPPVSSRRGLFLRDAVGRVEELVGVYLYRLQAADYVSERKMLSLK